MALLLGFKFFSVFITLQRTFGCAFKSILVIGFYISVSALALATGLELSHPTRTAGAAVNAPDAIIHWSFAISIFP